MTPAEFLTRYPEFRTAGTDLIQQKLDDATLRVNRGTFGDSADDATAMLTGHLIVMSPWGRSLRTELGGADDAYKTMYNELCAEKIPRMLVL